jgi:hypothetical protein
MNVRRWFLHPVIERLEKIMSDVTALTQAVSDLEAQRAVDHQLITDLLAALNVVGGPDQGTIDALTARVQAVTSAEKADDDAGNAALNPAPADGGDQGAPQAA